MGEHVPTSDQEPPRPLRPRLGGGHRMQSPVSIHVASPAPSPRPKLTILTRAPSRGGSDTHMPSPSVSPTPASFRRQRSAPRVAGDDASPSASPFEKTSQYRGVSACKNAKNPWEARCRVGKKKHHIGVFSTEEEAAVAYDTFALSHGKTIVNFSPKRLTALRKRYARKHTVSPALSDASADVGALAGGETSSANPSREPSPLAGSALRTTRPHGTGRQPFASPVPSQPPATRLPAVRRAPMGHPRRSGVRQKLSDKAADLVSRGDTQDPVSPPGGWGSAMSSDASSRYTGVRCDRSLGERPWLAFTPGRKGLVTCHGAHASEEEAAEFHDKERMRQGRAPSNFVWHPAWFICPITGNVQVIDHFRTEAEADAVRKKYLAEYARPDDEEEAEVADILLAFGDEARM